MTDEDEVKKEGEDGEATEPSTLSDSVLDAFDDEAEPAAGDTVSLDALAEEEADEEDSFDDEEEEDEEGFDSGDFTTEKEAW